MVTVTERAATELQEVFRAASPFRLRLLISRPTRRMTDNGTGGIMPADAKANPTWPDEIYRILRRLQSARKRLEAPPQHLPALAERRCRDPFQRCRLDAIWLLARHDMNHG